MDQKGVLAEQDKRLDNAAKMLQQLRSGQPLTREQEKSLRVPQEPRSYTFGYVQQQTANTEELIPAANGLLIVSQSELRPQRNNRPSAITPARIAFAAWTLAEAVNAYKSLSQEEWDKMSYAKRSAVVALRTVRNMLSRPAQIAALPSKALHLLENKMLASTKPVRYG